MERGAFARDEKRESASGWIPSRVAWFRAGESNSRATGSIRKCVSAASPLGCKAGCSLAPCAAGACRAKENRSLGARRE